MPVVLYEIQPELFPNYVDSRNTAVIDPTKKRDGEDFDGFFTIKEASRWATVFLERSVSEKAQEFLTIYNQLVQEYGIQLNEYKMAA